MTDRLPPTSFCVLARCGPELSAYEEVLTRQHDAGVLQIIDRGSVTSRKDPIRRWRVRWGHGAKTVRAVVAITDHDFVQGDLLCLVRADAPHPWTGRAESPLFPLGLSEYPLRDGFMGYFFGVCEAAKGADFAEALAETITVELRGTPLLLIPQQVDLDSAYGRFARATAGAVGVAALSAELSDAVNDLLPAHLRTNPTEARLYMPSGCDDDHAGLTIAPERLHRPAEWARLAKTSIHWSSWRPDGHPFPLTVEMWDRFLNEAWAGDERVAIAGAGTPGPAARWVVAPDESGKQILRQRLKQFADEADSARIQVVKLQDDTQRLSTRLERSERARHRLTAIVLRLRRAHHDAVSALHRTAIGEALRQADDARTERDLYAEELQRAEDELDDLRRRLAWQTSALAELGRPATDTVAAEPTRFTTFTDLLDAAATELTGLVIGEQVADAAALLDGNLRTPRWLRRAWNALSALNSYVTADFPGDFTSYVDGRGGEFGLTPSLVARWESRMVDTTDRFRAARTFPVPTELDDSGWTYFPAHIRIDRGGGVAPRLHYLDDTNGRTGRVHIGYLGPHLISPLTN